MQTRHIGSVLVTTEDGDLEGICTERDIVYRVVARGLPPDRTQLHQVMTRDPDTIGPRERAIEALRRMEDGGYRHLFPDDIRNESPVHGDFSLKNN